jgi:hypothetical protein
LASNVRHHALESKSAPGYINPMAFSHSLVRGDDGLMTTMKKTSRPFSHIDTWVFDLDNTLYPHHVNLWQQVDVRIGEFIANYLKLPADEARWIQKDYYRRYGTSMRGMMTEHGVSADDYLAYVHQIDHSPLQPNPAMGAAIANLPGRKLILTNGSASVRISRRCSTSSPPNWSRSRRRKPIKDFLTCTVSMQNRLRCSRIWRAISWCRINSA